MRICCFVLIVCILCIITHSVAENILILPGMETGSHFLFMKIVGKALLDREHHVTFILGESHSHDLNDEYSVLRFNTNVTVKTWKRFWNNLAVANSRGEHIHPLSYNHSQMKTLVYDGCHSLLRDTGFMNNLKYNTQRNYSVIIGDILNPCAPIISLYLSIPLVEVATGSITASLVYLSTHTVDPSYFPRDSVQPTVAPLKLHQHALQSTRILVATLNYQNKVLTSFDHLKADFNIRPDISIYTAMSRAKLWLFNVDFSLEVTRPLMPNSIFVGGITATEPRSLPKKIEKFMLKSENGVVVVSLGSYFNDMDKEISEIWASAFARLDQRVIWSYSGVAPATLGKNTLLVKSIPQNDVLGHYKAKVFVTHAGLNGVYEAIYHSVPMVCIPFSGDQFNNAKRVALRNLGTRIEAHDLTADILYDAIKEVLNNPIYKTEIQYRSKLLRDKNMPAPQRAAFWIEHVAKQEYDDTQHSSTFRNLWDNYMLSLWLRILLAIILFCLFVLLVFKLLLVVVSICKLCGCRPPGFFRNFRRRFVARKMMKFFP